MTEFTNGKIYKLISPNTDDVYVGSTTETLSIRFSKHKYDFKINQQVKKFR